MNHANLGDPGTTCGGSGAGAVCTNTAGTFGRVTSSALQNTAAPAFEPRIAQLSLKLIF